jgi:hypothetical protein
MASITIDRYSQAKSSDGTHCVCFLADVAEKPSKWAALAMLCKEIENRIVAQQSHGIPKLALLCVLQVEKYYLDDVCVS